MLVSTRRRRGGRGAQSDDSHRRYISVTPNLAEIHEELEQTDEECFGWATGKRALGDITLDEYFDRLIHHIREDGTRHTWDRPSANLSHSLEVDLIAGAFKSIMLRPSQERLSHADGEQLKALCLLFYREAQVAELQRLIELDVKITLASLSPYIIDILGMIAYARRHAEVFEHLVKNCRASCSSSDKTSFDHITAMIMSDRQRSSKTFQHSTNTRHNRELEWRFWTALLNAEPGLWLHYPLLEVTSAAGIPIGLFHGLHWLANYWTKDYKLRASPIFAKYLRALSERGIDLGASTISCFLSVTEGSSRNFAKGPFIPVGAGPARTMLECFPLTRWLSSGYRGADSAQVALPITQWPTNNPDRLVVMEILLEQGLVVDGKLSESNSEYIPGMGEREQEQDTCLIKAAERGDAEMVDLLLKHGSDRNLQGAHGHTAAQRARKKGQRKMAVYLESIQD